MPPIEDLRPHTAEVDILSQRAEGPDNNGATPVARVKPVAVWIVLIGAVALAVIASVVLLLVLFATRQKTRSIRLPGFNRIMGRESDHDVGQRQD